MDVEPQEWEQEVIRLERESYIVLQHLYTVADADPRHVVPVFSIATDLGFPERRCGELIEHLIRIGFLAWGTTGLSVSIAPAGVEYIERLAWRRRSVREPQTSPTLPHG